MFRSEVYKVFTRDFEIAQLDKSRPSEIITVVPYRSQRNAQRR